MCITNKPRTHKIGISVGGDFDAARTTTTQLSMVSNNHRWKRTFVDDESSNGTPWRAAESVVYTDGRGTGPVQTKPRPDDLRALLPLLIGGSFSTNVIEPDVMCNFFRLEADKNVAIQMHDNAKTSGWTLSANRQNPILLLDWQIESCSFSKSVGGSFTSSLDISVLPPMSFRGSVLTIDGDTYTPDSFSLNCNNNLDPDLGWNSITRTDLPPGDQIFQLTTTTPFDQAIDASLQDLGAASVEASFLFTSGLTSLLIEFPALHASVDTPDTPSGNATVKNDAVVWTARSSGTGVSYKKPIKFTLDDVPGS